MLNRLLTYFLFAGTTFFAAGSSATGGGTSSTGGGAAIPPGGDGGIGGGDTSTTPGGDGSTAGGDSRQTTTGDSTQDGTDDFSGSFEDDFSEGASSDDLDVSSRDEFGPETYQKLKKSLAADQNLFKTVKKGLSMLKRFNEHVETPEKAGELLGKLTTLGGIEGLEQEMGETATFLNGWNAGDAQVIAQWLNDNGDGLPGAMPTVLEHWRKADPGGWAHDASQTFMATMLAANSETGLSAIAALNALAQKEGIKDTPEMKTLLGLIEGIKRRADTEPQRQKPQVDEKLNARERQVQQQEQSLRRQALGGKAAPMLNREASNALKIVIGNRKLSAEQRSQLTTDIHNEFSRLAAADA